jgi:hypothetical protein
MAGETIEARIAVMENQLAHDKEERECRRKELDKKLEAMTLAADNLVKEIGRYKGFVGGMSLMVSILWAGIAFFKEQIIKALS